MRYADHLDMNALKHYASALNRRSTGKEKVNAADLRGVILDSGGRCAWCSTNVVNADFEIDHVIPVSDGGRGHAENLVLSCPSCNRRKSAKHPAKFAQELYAETGTMSAALHRVFDHYDIKTAGHQLSLFDPPPQDTPLDANVSPFDDGEVPPYNWAAE